MDHQSRVIPPLGLQRVALLLQYVGPAAIRTEVSDEGESLWSQIQPSVGAGERLSIRCVAKIHDVWISYSDLIHVYAAPPQAASVSRAKGAGKSSAHKPFTLQLRIPINP